MRDERYQLTPDGLYWLSKRTGSPYWHRTWFDPAGRQTRRASLSTEDVREAHEKLIEWWLSQRRLVDERPETVAISEILMRYYEGHAQKLPSEVQAKIACRKLSDFCGDRAISEFTPQVQREFIESMSAVGASAGYIRRTLAVCKAAFAWGLDNQLLKIVPNIKLPADGKARERVLTVDEMHAIVDSAHEEHVYKFVILAIGTMARPDAILDLERSRCDMDRRLITLNPEGRAQTKKYRPTIPMVDATKHVIEDVSNGHIIAYRGMPIDSIKTGWRRLRKRAGLDNGVIPYLIRHTVATEIRAMGVPAWEVEGWLGHKRPGTTERYAKYAPDYLSVAATAVNNYMLRLPLRA